MTPGEQVPSGEALAHTSNGHASDFASGEAVAAATVTEEVVGRNGSALGEDLDGQGGRMTLLEHLAELRKRVLICAFAIVITSAAGYFLYNPVLHFMTEPYRAFYKHHHNLITGELVISTPVEGFTTRIKVSLYIGLALASPVWLWELWRFITPGLKRNEKRYAVPFLLSAMFLFALGVSTAVLVWPKALNWLIDASGSGVAPLFSPSGYVTLYLLICLVFGAVFLYPIIVVFLMMARVVPSTKWRRWRRPAIVILCLVAAVVTPSNDPFSFLGMAIPLVLLYEASIIVGRLLKR
ncbi:MAG TPA: twin-arginine translocase subunit TatC [Acidimicrobiales bacterium]|nr:twin-arginine translocase subunit TatC [Acidimicrobiales bacterium]